MLNVIVVLVALANTGEPPTDAEVLRTLPTLARGLPPVYETYRNDVMIVKDRVAIKEIKIPLFDLSTVTVVMSSWQCTTYYTETTLSTFPFPFTLTKPRVSVVTIEKAELAK